MDDTYAGRGSREAGAHRDPAYRQKQEIEEMVLMAALEREDQPQCDQDSRQKDHRIDQQHREPCIEQTLYGAGESHGDGEENDDPNGVSDPKMRHRLPVLARWHVAEPNEKTAIET